MTRSELVKAIRNETSFERGLVLLELYLSNPSNSLDQLLGTGPQGRTTKPELTGSPLGTPRRASVLHVVEVGDHSLELARYDRTCAAVDEEMRYE